MTQVLKSRDMYDSSIDDEMSCDNSMNYDDNNIIESTKITKVIELTKVSEMTDSERENYLVNFANNPMKFRGEYEKCYDCRVIKVPRRKEDTGWFSFMSYSTQSLVDEDASNFISDIRAIEEENADRKTPLNIHIFIDTDGGRLSTAEGICKAMLQYPGKIRTFVSDRAMSAGTMIALCSHEIYLRNHAHLGQIDPQIGSYWIWIPANSIEAIFNRISDLETPWIRDILKLSIGPAHDSNTRVEDLISRISETRNWTSEFTTRIRSNLLLNFKTGGFGHDKPLDYFDLLKFWIDSNENNANQINPALLLFADWPKSAKSIKNLSSPMKMPEQPKPSYMSMFGL